MQYTAEWFLNDVNFSDRVIEHLHTDRTTFSTVEQYGLSVTALQRSIFAQRKLDIRDHRCRLPMVVFFNSVCQKNRL